MSTVGTPGAIPAPPTISAYLGQGVSYPLGYNPNTGRLNISNGAPLVLQSIQSMLDCAPGERVMQPDYGANVGTFEPIDSGRVQVRLQANIAEHEPRVRSAAVRVDVGLDPSEMIINVTADIVGQATPAVLVVPYFVGPSS